MKKEKIICISSGTTQIIPEDAKRTKVEIKNQSGTVIYISEKDGDYEYNRAVG